MGARTQEAVTIRSTQTNIDLLRLLGVLAMGADDETGIVDPAPSRETLARLLECEPRTITNRVKKLLESGELTQLRVGSGPGNSSAYRINLEIPESTLLKGESGKEKGEKSAQNTVSLQQEMGEIRALIFTLSDEVAALKGEILEIKGERVKAKGGKGESERVKAHSFKSADDPLDPFFDPKEREDAPAPARGVVVTGEIHPDCPYPQNAEETAVAIHPATWAWLDAQMAWPGYSNAAYIAARLGESPDVGALRQARQLWSLSNNKPGNAVGILDWYDELRKDPGWTPGKRFSTNGKGPNKPAAPPPSAGLKPVAPGVF